MNKIIILFPLLFICGCSSVKIDEPPIPIGELDPPMVWDDDWDHDEYEEFNEMWNRVNLKEIPYEEPIKSKVLHDLIKGDKQ